MVPIGLNRIGIRIRDLKKVPGLLGLSTCFRRQLDTGKLVPCVRECRNFISNMCGLVCTARLFMNLSITLSITLMLNRTLLSSHQGASSVTLTQTH